MPAHRNVHASEIIIRPIRWGDIDAIVEQFERMWGEPWQPLSALVSRRFVLHYLGVSTRSLTAWRAGHFMGVALIRMQGEPPLFAKSSPALHAVDEELKSSPIGEGLLREVLSEQGVERQMETGTGIAATATAELELFLVAQDARGHGIGGELWRRMLHGFVGEGIRRFYLHTDDTCDTEFYDHRGMELAVAVHPQAGGAATGHRMPETMMIYAADPHELLARRGQASGRSSGHVPDRGPALSMPCGSMPSGSASRESMPGKEKM
ncbi:GNAT family N-acetyltransferase [Bifidobacterium sp.]|jgi:GNAT superfamily N-acetyltransferase|uniref:GNAT family N-acetyltransferase n=1 Tax=Bifidobacterium sp. TaxID=41200 RepID=UPI0025C6F63B|nr:GNAT family N-acetyltransferase [Bifidobacterium sp.]MCH4208834.1 GNAT family N-acetyltransferase [Bifidobacterium sp.]MCI1225370.1 GNAT family N-acetyltransferase [Bifidobacterium sp.]